MTTFTAAASYAAEHSLHTSAAPVLRYSVSIDGYPYDATSLSDVRSVVAAHDKAYGTARRVTVSEVVSGFVVASKVLRADWRNL